MKIVFELPFYSQTCGGVLETIKFGQKLYKHGHIVQFRFQRKLDKPDTILPYTYGIPDGSFPKCDIAITFSDTPFIDRLVELKQVGRVMINMLSYGMSINAERYNSHHPKVEVLCSTEKIKMAILNDGHKEVHKIGFGLEMDDMFNYDEQRKDILALYYHPMPSKMYQLAMDIATGLYGNGLIDGAISFGTKESYSTFKKMPFLENHTFNADRTQIRNIFNKAKIFLNPSISEGLNLTPIEATLCGCPSIICDGASEVLVDNFTCLMVDDGDYFDILNTAIELMSNYDDYQYLFENNMRRIVKEYTWDKVVDNFQNIVI